MEFKNNISPMDKLSIGEFVLLKYT